jgi:hypothetical protein
MGEDHEGVHRPLDVQRGVLPRLEKNKDSWRWPHLPRRKEKAKIYTRGATFLSGKKKQVYVQEGEHLVRRKEKADLSKGRHRLWLKEKYWRIYIRSAVLLDERESGLMASSSAERGKEKADLNSSHNVLFVSQY